CSRRKSIDRYTFVEDYKVVETNKPRANAYATGILPFSKTIIVGKGIDEYLNEQEQRALIYHEIYHHKANHMLKFYLITMVIYVTAACVWSWYLRKLPGNEYLHIALFYGGVAGVYQIVQGLVQRRFEKQADLYSVQQMGSYAQISALRKLYALSGTPENQKAINYPTLAQRERYVREKAPGLPD
ncbi:MAG: M48 family metalloprotease, partial [Prevotella sp.]|nr:M48 family metalloprotease [Prevotella sp.]